MYRQDRLDLVQSEANERVLQADASEERHVGKHKPYDTVPKEFPRLAHVDNIELLEAECRKLHTKYQNISKEAAKYSKNLTDGINRLEIKQYEAERENSRVGTRLGELKSVRGEVREDIVETKTKRRMVNQRLYKLKKRQQSFLSNTLNLFLETSRGLEAESSENKASSKEETTIDLEFCKCDCWREPSDTQNVFDYEEDARASASLSEKENSNVLSTKERIMNKLKKKETKTRVEKRSERTKEFCDDITNDLNKALEGLSGLEIGRYSAFRKGYKKL